MPKLRNIVYLSEAQKQILFLTGTITVGSTTVNYSDNDIYIVQQLWNTDGSDSSNYYIKDNTNTNRLTLSNSGIVTAAGFSGSGALLTNLNATNIVSGLLNTNLLSALTASSAVVTDTSGKLSVSSVTSTELGYLSGVTSAIQTQLNGKQNTLTNPVTGTGTANQIAYMTGTSTIGSLTTTTYPSLTELSYVKGVSSALQTQLNGKEPTIATKNTAFNKNYGTTATDVKMNGTQSVGSVDAIARIDHVHPTDTSRAPLSHTHGNITNDGKIGSTADLVVVTGTSGVLTTQSRTGIDNRTSFPANTLTTARNIGIGTGVTSTPTSFNGSSDITIPITAISESYLVWGGKGISGQVSPIGMAISNEHSANRLAFINGNSLSFEYSSDGGSTWNDYSYSATIKSQVCTTLSVVPIGRISSSEEYTTLSKTRVVLTAQNGTNQYVYTDPRKMLINVSNSGSMEVLIEYRTGANYLVDGAWTSFGTYSLSGWSGWNDIPLVLATLGGGPSQTGNNWQLRLTFSMTAKNTSYPTVAYLNSIRLYGSNSWSTPSTMANTGNLYAFDMSQNALFPATVRGTQLQSTVTTGTTPLIVASTTKVTNLNADLLDDMNATSANTVSTIVARDASGNFSAGTITANLTGTASGNLTSSSTLDATKLSGRVTLNNLPTAVAGQVLKGNGTNSPVWGTVAWDEVSSKPEVTSSNTASTIVLRDSSGNFSAGTITATLSGNATTVTNGVYTDTTQSITGLKTFTDLKLLNNANTGQLRLRSINTDDVLERILSIKTNNANRSLTISGDATISGVNTGDQTTITGNAGTATTLQTARTLTIGSTGKTFNGGADVTWSLAEIGAASSSSLASHESNTSNPHSVTASQVGLGTSSTPTFASVILGSGSETWSIDDATANTLSFKIGGSAKATLTNTGVLTATTFVGALTGTASGNLTSSSTLDASKLSGAISTSVTQSNWDGAVTAIADIINGDVAVGEAMYAETALLASNIDSTNTNTGYTGAYSMWIGTQAQYDAIGTKSTSTIYYVI